MKSRPLWKGRNPAQKITVRSIPRKPGQGGGVCKVFQPWEKHPDWSLFSVSGPTPTIFNSVESSVTTIKNIPAGVWYPIMNSDYGLVDDCEMSCIMNYEGHTSNFETYMLAKGQDENNFVGVTSYNNKIMLYERVGGAWGAIGIDTPVSGTLGKEVKMIIVGDQITLFVDGNEIGTGTTGITGGAYMGSLLRGLPIHGLLWSNMTWTGNKVNVAGNAVIYHGYPVTINTLAVKYNA